MTEYHRLRARCPVRRETPAEEAQLETALQARNAAQLARNIQHRDQEHALAADDARRRMLDSPYPVRRPASRPADGTV